ncbi:MAG: hypothetical protein IJS97_06790 [Prevotella sp.]|nr:hypothetical protein [Prevotella sp.]
MNRLQLFKALRRHRKLAEKRAINFNENKVAKWLVIVASSMMVIYLMGFAIMFSLAINDDRTTTPVEFIVSFAPFILTLDFLFRFIAQQTPAQLIKPYMLLPIPKYACIESFILSSLLTWGNTIWFCMFIPYAIMSVCFSYGMMVTVSFLLFYWLLIMANSQWYAIVRTLINKTLLYWLLPLLFYAVAFFPVILHQGGEEGWEQLMNMYGQIGTAVNNGSILPCLGAAILLVVVVLINRKVQYHHIYQEVSKNEKTTLHHVSRFTFLEHYGEIGQYLQIEIKSLIRNKNPRKSYIFATAGILLVTFLIIFTDVYDNVYMTNFWCTYNYLMYGSIMIIKIMSYEGNYIDLLMTHHENILKLLRAKYIFYSLLLLFPFLLMLPLVFSGKWSLFMLVSFGVFTAGFQYFVLFQMAIYNKTTLPLNAKLMSKNGIENNYIQVIAQMGTMFIPLIFVVLLKNTLGETIAFTTMFVIGLFFIITHKIWLRNIYQRMMKRKYTLIEGWHSTR